MHGKLLTFGCVNGESYITIPWIVSFLIKRYIDDLILDLTFAFCIQIDKKIASACSIHIPRYRSHKTGYVSRTACTTEPSLTIMLSHTCQRIIVEETVT